MLDSSNKKSQKGYHSSLSFEKEQNEIDVFIAEEIIKKRSVSHCVKIPKEFVPKLKPKKSKIFPSPIGKLSSKKINTASVSSLSRSFDEDEYFNHKKNEFGLMRNLMNEYRSSRSKTLTSKTSKDDNFYYTPEKLYKNLSAARNSFVYWTFQHERTSSIINFLENY